MKQIFCTICCLLFAVATAFAQDFASKYMQENGNDASLHCISVSPKMMEEILKTDAENAEQEEMRNIIANLKSMQIVSSDAKGHYFFNKAEEMVEKNIRRFELFLSFDEEEESCRILVRRKEGAIIELVLLSLKDENFQIINFTGNMNNEFIDNLAKKMMPRKETKN